MHSKVTLRFTPQPPTLCVCVTVNADFKCDPSTSKTEETLVLKVIVHSKYMKSTALMRNFKNMYKFKIKNYTFKSEVFTI